MKVIDSETILQFALSGITYAVQDVCPRTQASPEAWTASCRPQAGPPPGFHVAFATLKDSFLRESSAERRAGPVCAVSKGLGEAFRPRSHRVARS